MKNRSLWILLAFVTILILLPGNAAAQEQQEGKNSGNYNVRQTVEFGGRLTSFSGNGATYRTFDNLQDGPRLYEHTLQMRSLDHRGWLFDDFFLSSFGYGGDPNAVTRLRAYKNKWYNFTGTFRVARNQWDYNLLANPFNPPNSLVTTPTVPINAAFPADTSTPYSLHKFETVRRLSDFGLTLAPQSPLRVRLGYSRNISEGPSLSSFHEGTDILLFQDWKTTLNTYSFGVDFRGIPRTSISYDQFFIYYKGDTTWNDDPGGLPLGVPRFNSLLGGLAAGVQVPADLGIIFNASIASANSRQPCATPLTSQGPPPIANPTCNVYAFYERAGKVRTNYPTEQFSMQSSYFQNLDLSARVSYSSSDADVIDYNQLAIARVTRTNAFLFGVSGPVSNKRVSVTADFGGTWMPPGQEKLRFVDTFHFTHFRLPGFFDLSECSLFSTSLAVAPLQYTTLQPTLPTLCAAGAAAVQAASGLVVGSGTPTHSTSSAADITGETFATFFGQDTRQNQFEVLYDFHRRFQGRVGYRYTKRFIRESFAEGVNETFFPSNATRGDCATTAPNFANCVVLSDGVSRQLVLPVGGLESDSAETEINEHVGLLGFHARPIDTVRIIYDMEIGSADHSFTRISPRQYQFYRIRAMYQPNHWFNFGFLTNILEKRNNVDQIFHKQHNRTYGFTATFEPNEKFTLDVGYDFNDVSSQTNICFTLTSTPLPPGSSACAQPVSQTSGNIQAISLYSQDTHYAHFDMVWKPWKRVRTNLGYNLVSTSGDTLFFTNVTPPGTLSYNYHRPYAGVDLDLTGGFTFRTSWGYYGYNEKSDADRFSRPRDFRGNLVNLSIRYSF